MKQIILTSAIFLMIASSHKSSAQSNNDVALNLRALVTSNFKEKTSELSLAKVNVRAMRDFSRSFKNAPQAKWFETENGYAASFTSDGKNTKIVYDNKGRRTYSIISYTESKLDRSIRTQVKNLYFDASIIGVHEFEFDNKTVYAIKMIDQNSVPMSITLLCDGQIEDITSYAKK